MATLAGTQNNVIEAIISLLELEYDSIELYEAVIKILQDDQYKAVMSNFKDNHESNVERLLQLLDEYDVEFIKTPQAVGISQVVLDKLTYDDIDIMNVIMHAEEDGIIAYERMLRYDDISHSCIEAFKKGLIDGTKCREWLLNVEEGTY